MAANFDFVNQNGQMQILLKQEVLNQAEKMRCQIRYVDYKLKSIHDFIDSLPSTFHSWALVRKTSVASERSDLETLQPVEATEAPAREASVPSPRGPKPKTGARARRAAVVTLTKGESAEDASKKAAMCPVTFHNFQELPGIENPTICLVLSGLKVEVCTCAPFHLKSRSHRNSTPVAREPALIHGFRCYFTEANRLQCNLTAEVIREICQHIYDSAA